MNHTLSTFTVPHSLLKPHQNFFRPRDLNTQPSHHDGNIIGSYRNHNGHGKNEHDHGKHGGGHGGGGHGHSHGHEMDYDGDEETDQMQHLHCHNYTRKNNLDEIREKKEKARKKLITASIICSLFMTAEIIGGVLSHSIG